MLVWNSAKSFSTFFPSVSLGVYAWHVGGRKIHLIEMWFCWICQLSCNCYRKGFSRGAQLCGRRGNVFSLMATAAAKEKTK